MVAGITPTTTDRTFMVRVVAVIGGGEVAMGDAEPTLEPRLQSSSPGLEMSSIHLKWMEWGSNLIFRWAIYATLNLIDDPAMLAIVFA